MSKDKTPNYTPEQEQEIRDASPLNLESAKALADTMGKSYRSIIAKAKNMGLDYESQPAPSKRPAKETKSEIVAEIETALSRDDNPVASLDGLTKSTLQALVNLRQAVKAL